MTQADLKYVPRSTRLWFKAATLMILATQSQDRIIEGGKRLAGLQHFVGVAAKGVGYKLILVQKGINGVDMLEIRYGLF